MIPKWGLRLLVQCLPSPLDIILVWLLPLVIHILLKHITRLMGRFLQPSRGQDRHTECILSCITNLLQEFMLHLPIKICTHYLIQTFIKSHHRQLHMGPFSQWSNQCLLKCIIHKWWIHLEIWMIKENHTLMISKDLTLKILHTIIRNHRKTTRTEINKIKGRKITKKNSQTIDILRNAKDPEIKKIVMTLKVRKFSKNKNTMKGKAHTIKILKNDQKIKTKELLFQKNPKKSNKMKINSS